VAEFSHGGRKRANSEGSLFYDQARQRWVGLITLPDGRRRKVSHATKTGARKNLDTLRAQVVAGLPVVDGNSTVGDWLVHWRDNILPARVKSPNTVDNYRTQVDIHLLPALGSKRLVSLSVEQVERMLAEARHQVTGERLSHRSLLRLRSVLKMALHEAVRRQHLARNVAPLAVLPGDSATVQRRRSMTVDQARAVLAAAQGDRLEALWTVALLRGLRPGELLGLTWADVDLDATPPVLHLRESMKFEYVTDRAGERRPVYRLGQLKAAGPRRSIALPAPVVEALRRHRHAQLEERLALGAAWHEAFADLGGLVFTSYVGTPLDRANVRRTFSKLLRRAGVEGKWTVYEMRHTAVSLLSDKGAPPEQIADLLGHRDTRMVLLTYRHAVLPVVDGASAVMGELFSPVAPPVAPSVPEEHESHSAEGL
jgi:integrase